METTVFIYAIYQRYSSPVMTSISFPAVASRVAESITSKSFVALSSGEVGGMSIPAAVAAAIPMSVATNLSRTHEMSALCSAPCFNDSLPRMDRKGSKGWIPEVKRSRMAGSAEISWHGVLEARLLCEPVLGSLGNAIRADPVVEIGRGADGARTTRD